MNLQQFLYELEELDMQFRENIKAAEWRFGTEYYQLLVTIQLRIKELHNILLDFQSRQ